MIELAPGIFLHSFQNSSQANVLLGEQEAKDTEIIFKGDISLLMELSSRYVLKTDLNKYKDYYFNSQGFDASTMSLQSAIWASEQTCSQKDSSNYFVILKKKKEIAW